MYPKTPGCFSDLSAALYYKSYCFFLKLLIVLPVHFPLLHFTPPKVLRFYYNLTFRCVRYFGGSANLIFSNLPRLNNLMQHFGILRRELKEGIKYNESKELQEIIIKGKRRNQPVIGARIIIQEHCGIA